VTLGVAGRVASLLPSSYNACVGGAAERVLVATSTWNNRPIVELFIDYYRAVGASAVLALDFGSTDGTRELLAEHGADGFVHALDLPDLAEMRQSTILLRHAKEHFPTDTWCLFCDPDEFLVTSDMQLATVCRDVDGAIGALLVPRHNVTAPRSAARDPAARMMPDGVLTLRIDRRWLRGAEALQEVGRLEPPWIFTAVPGKVVVRLEAANEMPISDHEATLEPGWTTVEAADAYLLHYPFRTFTEFVEKVELATLDFAANDWPPGYGWQYQSWFRARERGELFSEYLDQFVADEEVPTLLAAGALVEDESVWQLLDRQR